MDGQVDEEKALIDVSCVATRFKSFFIVFLLVWHYWKIENDGTTHRAEYYADST